VERTLLSAAVGVDLGFGSDFDFALALDLLLTARSQEQIKKQPEGQK
jgi:hypothetical protein